MKDVLVVEDTKLFARVLKHSIETTLDLNVILAMTYAEALQKIEEQEQKDEPFLVSLLDLNLPDAPDGEIVDYVTKKGIPAIVFTGSFDEKIRERIISKHVLDYVVKENAASVGYLLDLIKRVIKNKTTTVLVVDDSTTQRAHIVNLLKNYQFQVLEAEDGIQAIEVMEASDDPVRLVITDYYMPNMDGFDLTKKIREKHPKEELAIIGMSSGENNLLTARFIKNGANDFITKPFEVEEFFCRVIQNVEITEYIEALKNAAIRDFLTGLYNRRYFFDTGAKNYKKARKAEKKISVAMVDVDFFKKVNDTYGHDAGDEVLVLMSTLLKGHFQSGEVIARFGGEEFCVMVLDIEPDAAFTLFESLRQLIEDQIITFERHTIRITASIGLCNSSFPSLHDMVTKSDEMLYAAKTGGRNRVIRHDD